MADNENDRFCGIDRAHAKRSERGIRVGFRVPERRYLRKIGYLHAHLVNHACMEHLALKIERIAFLAGMGYRKEGGGLALAVVKDHLKVSEGFRFFTAHEADDRCLHADRVPAGVYGAVAAGFFYRIRDEFTRMAGVGGGTDTGGKEHGAGLLGWHRDPAGPLFCAGQVAFPVHAQAAEIAEGHIEWLVPGEEFRSQERSVASVGYGVGPSGSAQSAADSFPIVIERSLIRPRPESSSFMVSEIFFLSTAAQPQVCLIRNTAMQVDIYLTGF